MRPRWGRRPSRHRVASGRRNASQQPNANPPAQKSGAPPNVPAAKHGEPMPINILMPALSPTMEKGNLAKWLKHEGDKVKTGDILAEIETDKATMEYEAVDDGVLAKIVVPEGTADVPVNQLIAVLAGEGEDVKAAAAGAGQGAAPAKSQAGPSAETRPAGAPQGAGAQQTALSAQQAAKPAPRPEEGARAPAAKGEAP